jgi:hypothetical protein
VVDPGDVTGDVYLRLDFDDGTNDLTASYSLDGGSAFTPFGLTLVSGMTPGTGGTISFLGDPVSVDAQAVPTLGSGMIAVLLLSVGLLAALRRWRSAEAS